MEVVEMGAVNDVSQCGVLVGCNDLLDLQAHVGYRGYDELQGCDVLFEVCLEERRARDGL